MTVAVAGALGVVAGIALAVGTRRLVWWVFSDIAPRRVVMTARPTTPPIDVRPLTGAARQHALNGLAVGWEACTPPNHLRGGLERYLVDGILPGSFLQAVLCADLVEAAQRGDPRSLLGLPALVQVLRWYVPSDRWGSRDAVLRWTTTPDRLEV